MAGSRGPADSFQEENIIRLPLDVALTFRTGEVAQSTPTASAVDRDSGIFDGYVEVLDQNRSLVVKRPGRTMWSEHSLTLSKLMGMYYYPGRTELDRSETLAVAYGTRLLINPEAGVSELTFTGLFPAGGDPGIASTDVQLIYFEGVPLPDLVRSTAFPTDGKTTSNPPLEGFFINSWRDAYFYNTRGRSLTKIVSPNYPFEVVGGAQWLNGRFYVMTPEGRIHASGINDPYTWSALDFINAIMSPDGGIGLSRQHTYLLAFGRYSSEVFYDSGAAVGNPLRRVDSAAKDFGCMHAGSIVKISDTTLFAGYQSNNREVGIFRLEGYQPRKISTVFIDRLIANADYDCMWCYPLFYNGHRFYLVNACCMDFTLVYDLDTDKWFVWLTKQLSRVTNPVLTAAIDSVTGRVEVTINAGSFISAGVGDPIEVTGVTGASVYEGNFVVHRDLSSTSITYLLETSTLPTTPAPGTPVVLVLKPQGGITTADWSTATSVAGPASPASFDPPLTKSYLLDRRQGNVYIADTEVSTDENGVTGNDNSFIDFTIRTPRFDAGNNLVKFFPRLELICDDSETKVLIRYSDDDYQTWSTYRLVNMNLARTRLHRQGSARRRSWEVRLPYTRLDGNDATTEVVRVEALEVFTKQGSNI